MLEPRKPLDLKKHVATIHSSNTLSLLQRKISNALLFNAYDELLIKEEHEINIGYLCKLIGYNSNDHKTIKKALVDLLSSVLEWNLVDGDKLNCKEDITWNASSIIADASIKGSVCTYSYSNKMKKLLHHPDLYGRINMLVQAKFQSNYGLALYENCIRYQDIGQTPWFDFLKFRQLMGVEEGKYKIFRDFKSRVLDKAVAEVNQYSPILVDPQLRRQNRQVTAIQFQIKKMEMLALDSQEVVSSSTRDLIPLLKTQFGLSQRQSENVVASYGPHYIREKIALTEQSTSFKKGKIKNLARYLLCALKEDYQITQNLLSPETKERKLCLRAEAMEAKEEQRRRDDLEKRYSKYRAQTIDNALASLSLEVREAFIERFLDHAAPTIKSVLKLQRGKYTRATVLQSPLVKASLHQFALEQFAFLASGLLPIEQFAEGFSEGAAILEG